MSILFSLALAWSVPLVGVEGLHRLDLLPVLRPGVKTLAVTSYDRTEGNDDGFSGKYSFVRKEGDHLVLADLQGPGCITRIHTPTPTDDPIEFYFDGEATPRVSLPFRKLFTGEAAPFRRPLVDYAGGGYTCYVPMAYAKSCKVVLRGKHLQFYDLNFTTYPSGSMVRTFDPKEVSEMDLERASAVFNGGRSSDLTEFNVPAGSKLRRAHFEQSLAAGKAITLFEAKKGGRIASLRLGPASAFVGKDRNVLIRVTWDGDRKPAILMPVGDFFGYAWGQPAMGSSLVGTFGDTNYCNLPMPFDRSAKIELVSLRDGTPVSVRGEVVTADAPRKPDEGKFYAVWRRENPTTEGKPFTWLEMQGRGHLVGVSVQAQGLEAGNTFFFEGDDKTVVDGEMLIHGTGSEDFLNGGWYDVPGRWDGPVARALSGCMAYQRYLSRTGGYRFFLNDAYRFDRSIVQTIEHAPTKNEHPSDYTGVAYLYADRAPTGGSDALSIAVRRVRDPERLVYSAHWTMPIDSFSLAGTTLTRGEIPAGGDRRVRALSLRAQGEGDFGLCFVALRADIPGAGRYKVYIDAVKGPNAGKVQLFREEAALGEAVDLYAEQPQEANGILMGEFTAVEGGNGLMFKVIGKNPAAKGLGMDLVNVICVKSQR